MHGTNIKLFLSLIVIYKIYTSRHYTFLDQYFFSAIALHGDEVCKYQINLFMHYTTYGRLATKDRRTLIALCFIP
jgi:hypothetical protein